MEKLYTAADGAKALLNRLDDASFTRLLPLKELYDAQQILIVAGGAQRAAAESGKAVFAHLAKMDVWTRTLTDFTCFFPKEQMGFSPNTPLAVVLSPTGADSDTLAAVERAQKGGANVLLVTNDENAPAADIARHVLPMELQNPSPAALHTAFVAVLIALAIRFARAKSLAGVSELEGLRAAAIEDLDQWKAALPGIADWTRRVASALQQAKAFQLIADDADSATALAGAAYLADAGYRTFVSDSGERLVSAQLQGAATLLTANPDTRSFDLLVRCAKESAPCVVVSSADKAAFPEGCALCATPSAARFWLAPLTQHLVFACFAKALTELKGGETA